ncbi:MAG: hypothetical protein GEU75_11770 [Dehalococcoidia bacterium]|nr:hypothetical protein [Dehalococcoidia bacterium]
MLRALALAMVLFMAAAVACSDDRPPTPAVTVTLAPVASPAATAVPAATPVANVCGPNPSPAPAVQPSDFSYRMIASPLPGAVVQSPLTVSGQANPFEGAFSVTVFSAAGQQIAAGDFNKSNLSPAFSVALPFSVMAPSPACVWYHERSGRDGSPINVTQVPVLLQP